ncbi:hypothetical protein SAMD00019534_000830 [Acytostelium subglobosum LB1]|uniref:hypothetical protein n=1 Tax=Acytostelium subglobosum LB1 TaxID=1410327 RepID=UPI000644C963|nr:hypothetical protein SAMD00019534_000830 [Acytostelium subglobosum LB1]GAM16908.1 hypothetical protein SAMD00019534_000830 [Acytostelium subglobosum LB1]|eukprot:XP_012758970.1 hypothetical protein SAMD00019534_000830 [Acytostelium subglobosum LB1]
MEPALAEEHQSYPSDTPSLATPPTKVKRTRRSKKSMAAAAAAAVASAAQQTIVPSVNESPPIIQHVQLTSELMMETPAQTRRRSLAEQLKQNALAAAAKKQMERSKYLVSSIGIDEAGKGAVLGPLVIAAVSLNEQAEHHLRAMGVMDSKRLSPARREQLYEVIKEHALYTTIYLLEARDIDRMRQTKTLNQIETEIFLELIQRSADYLKENYNAAGVLATKTATTTAMDMNEHQEEAMASMKEGWRFTVQLDSLERNNVKFAQPFVRQYPSPEFDIICETKADDKYIATSAASIIAKVERDRAIAALQEKLQTPIGCGYPSDPVTISFIEHYHKTHNSDHQDVRLTWKTLTSKRNKVVIAPLSMDGDGATSTSITLEETNANAMAKTKAIQDVQKEMQTTLQTMERATSEANLNKDNNTLQSESNDQFTIILKSIQRDMSSVSKSIELLVELIRNQDNNNNKRK